MSKHKQLDLFFDFSAPPVSDEQAEEVENQQSVEDIAPDVIDIATPTHTDEPALFIEEKKDAFLFENKVEIKKSTRGRKSIKEMEASADLIEVPEDAVLFSKLYYSMSEVTQMFKVNHSLLRFWEAEFTILKPRKNKKGDRLFRPEDIKNIEVIHHLLRIKKLTIQGAKDHFKNSKKLHQKFETIQKLQKLKTFLLEVKSNLK
jgi:DNA-binding transcriptional MerR regulator